MERRGNMPSLLCGLAAWTVTLLGGWLIHAPILALLSILMFPTAITLLTLTILFVPPSGGGHRWIIRLAAFCTACLMVYATYYAGDMGGQIRYVNSFHYDEFGWKGPRYHYPVVWPALAFAIACGALPPLVIALRAGWRWSQIALALAFALLPLLAFWLARDSGVAMGT